MSAGVHGRRENEPAGAGERSHGEADEFDAKSGHRRQFND